MEDDKPKFAGTSYDPELDEERLAGQMPCMCRLMEDAVHRTLREISDETRIPEASVSARLRDFRKAKWGGHIVNKRRRGDPKHGLWEYQLILAPCGLLDGKEREEPQQATQGMLFFDSQEISVR